MYYDTSTLLSLERLNDLFEDDKIINFIEGLPDAKDSTKKDYYYRLKIVRKALGLDSTNYHEKFTFYRKILK